MARVAFTTGMFHRKSVAAVARQCLVREGAAGEELAGQGLARAGLAGGRLSIETFNEISNKASNGIWRRA